MMRKLITAIIALVVLAGAPAAGAQETHACPAMRLYRVTGHKVEPQFTVKTGRLVARGTSCAQARSVVRALNRLPFRGGVAVVIRANGQRWVCRRVPDFGTGDFDSRCTRADARVTWRQPAILD